VVFDSKTPAALARIIQDEIAARPVDFEQAPVSVNPSGSADAGSETLSAIFREAVNSGPMKKAFDLLAAVANVRPSFSSLADLGQAPAPVKLVDGPGRPRLIFVSTPMATGGPYQLARLANHFRDIRTVMALPLSGFTTGESLPTTAEAAIEALAGSALLAAEGEPFVLVGYSAGGLLARVTTRYLEDHCGVSPAGLVMLDSYRADSDQAELDRGLVLAMLEKEAAFGGFDVARLSTMGRYVELVPDLVPGTVETKVLFIQCTESFSPEDTPEGGSWQAQPFEGAVVQTVAANHFTMLDEKAELTVGAIEGWLDTIS